MEALKRMLGKEEFMELVKEITDLIIQNQNVDKMFVIDAIQMLIQRRANHFMLFNECEEVFNIIKSKIC